MRAGKAKYDAKKHALVWKIKRFTGAAEQSLIASVDLIATTREKKAWSRPPISLTFQARCVGAGMHVSCMSHEGAHLPDLPGAFGGALVLALSSQKVLQ